MITTEVIITYFTSMPMRIIQRDMIDSPICFVSPRSINRLRLYKKVSSGSPSTRINLSPFTKDFRGGEQLE